MNGNDILIYSGGVPIAATAKGNEIDTACEAIEVSGPETGEWRQFIAGKRSWQVQTNYLVAAASGLEDLLKVGQTYALEVRDRKAGTVLTGSALCVECRIAAVRGTLLNGSFVFTGTGELKKA